MCSIYDSRRGGIGVAEQMFEWKISEELRQLNKKADIIRAMERLVMEERGIEAASRFRGDAQRLTGKWHEARL